MTDVSFTAEHADYFDLTVTEVEVVGLVERRFSRQAIAAYLDVSEQTARNIIGDLCDFYRVPTAELPAEVRRQAILRFRASEVSTTKGRDA